MLDATVMAADGTQKLTAPAICSWKLYFLMKIACPFRL